MGAGGGFRSLSRRDPQQHLLAASDGNLRRALAGDFVAAIVIRRELDHARLRGCAGKKRKEEASRNDEGDVAQWGIPHKM